MVRIFCCPAVHDDHTLWQGQWTPLISASKSGRAGAVHVLVDSKANMEARNKVAMWLVQPGVGDTSVDGAQRRVQGGSGVV